MNSCHHAVGCNVVLQGSCILRDPGDNRVDCSHKLTRPNQTLTYPRKPGPPKPGPSEGPFDTGLVLPLPTLSSGLLNILLLDTNRGVDRLLRAILAEKIDEGVISLLPRVTPLKADVTPSSSGRSSSVYEACWSTFRISLHRRRFWATSSRSCRTSSNKGSLCENGRESFSCNLQF